MPLPHRGQAQVLLDRPATTVAHFGEVLKKSFWAQGITLQDVSRTAADHISEDDAADVRELRELIQKAAGLPAAKR